MKSNDPAVAASSIVLLSGGVDSAVLLAAEAQRGYVYPLYVTSGLAWEAAELTMLEGLLASPAFAHGVAPLRRVALDMRGFYPADHWALRGAAPAYHTPDDAVYLAGRNVVLITQAALMAVTTASGRIAIGSLAGNPFPDATPEFFGEMSRALSTGLRHRVDVVAPLGTLAKHDVVMLGAALRVPFELTLSCMMPALDSLLPTHCGQCSKCRERLDAFAMCGLPDLAHYAPPLPR